MEKHFRKQNIMEDNPTAASKPKGFLSFFPFFLMENRHAGQLFSRNL